MLKPRNQIPRNYILWGGGAILVIAGIIVLTLAFNTSGNSGQDSVDAVYTNAAATLAAQQLTLGPATATPTIFSTATASLTPTITPTFQALPIGPTNTLAASGGGSTAVGCNNSAFVSDVTIPDDTAMTPGQTFTKTWKLSNTGSCPWTTTYKVSFVSGNAMGGVATPLTVTIAPGASGDISVAMTAPATAGDAIGYWILTNDSGQNFGSSFYVKIKVGGTTTTGTPGTATATATGVVVTKPSAANNPNITLTCVSDGGTPAQYKFSGTLTWEDTSSNETGFKIYINNVLVNTTAAGATSYSVPEGAFFPEATPLVFGVEAFNSGGSASISTVTRQCP